MQTEQPELNEFINKVKPFSRKLKYPIHNFAQLAEVLGGEEATVEWEGKKVTVGQGQKLIPSYFFPIESEEDLYTKAVNLELLRPGNKLMPHQMGHEEKPSPDRSRPEENVDDPEFRKRFKGHEGGPSIVRGHKASSGSN